MKRKVMKRSKQIFTAMLAALFLVSVPMLEVSAAETADANEEVQVLDAVITKSMLEDKMQNPNARTTLANCMINVVCDSEGMLVEFCTDTVGTASSIGVKDIKIQKKVWYGWKTVVTSEGAESEDINTFACTIIYTGAEVGETYRVSCVHYGTVDVYNEVEHTTDSFVFTY